MTKPNPFTNPSKQREAGFIGDQSTADVGCGVHIDPRRYIDEDVDFTDTNAIMKAGGHLATLCAFKACFEGLFLGLDTVDRKFLAKAMDYLRPKDAGGETDAPVIFQIKGLDVEKI